MGNELAVLKNIVESNKLLSDIIDVWSSEGSPYADLYKTQVDGKLVVSKAAMITAITVGMELGLSPQLALTMGKRLTAETVFSVIKGRELGIPLTTAMQHIITYTNKDGKIINIMDVHAVRNVLIQNNIIETVLEDMVPVFDYYTKDGKPILEEQLFTDGKLRPSIFIVDEFSSEQEITEAITDGKHLVVKNFNNNYRTTIQLKRGDNVVKYSYSSKEALNSGFFEKPGDLYLKHVRKMLHKQALHGAATIIAGDLLGGSYSPTEAKSFIENPEEIPDTEDLPVVNFSSEE